MGEGRDYFKTNAIREKCTVGKSSWRAPFILTLRAEEWSGAKGATRGDECFNDGRRIVL